MSASKRGRNNRAKGAEYEREVKADLCAAGIEASREGFKQRRARDGEPDVAAGIFAVECKDKLALNPHAVLAAHAEGVGEEAIPVLFWKRPRKIKDGKQVHPKSEIVVMRKSDWVGMAAIFDRFRRASEEGS